ncbi:MAG: hypothetical protein AAF526_12235 [Pseudomonadota bacterium]
MLKDYFGEFADGRLASGRFIFLWIVLIAGVLMLAIGIGLSIGLAERLIGGDLQEAQRLLRETLGLPAVLAFLAIGLGLAVAKLNIIAKRARDIGLPGWLTAIIIAGLTGGASQAAGEAASGGMGFILLLFLAFLPTGLIARR